MFDARSEDTLMALLALGAESDSGLRATAPDFGAPIAGLPTLDERIAMFARTLCGPDGIVTTEMRAVARDHILTAMAADLVHETAQYPAVPSNANNRLGSLVHTSPQPTISRISPQISAGYFRGLRKLISSVAAPLSWRGLGMAAVPLVALLVVGSLWSENRFNEVQHTAQGLPPSAPTTRSLGLQPADSVAEQNLQRAIATEEAAHGRAGPAIAGMLVDLADLYRADGRNAEAAALCERALIIEDRTLGSKSPEAIRTVKKLATAYRALGRTSDAANLLSRLDQP